MPEEVPNAGDPVSLLRLDQVPDDIEARPGVRPLVFAKPGIRKAAKQGIEDA
jgi:hypothetical protein